MVVITSSSDSESDELKNNHNDYIKENLNEKVKFI